MDLDTLTGLTKLPWQLQVVLASGYCAYLLAAVGHRHTHKTADTVFGSLAFGVIALVALQLTSQLTFLGSALLAFFAALVAAVLWRKLFGPWVTKVMRDAGYSSNDDTPRAWDHLLRNADNCTQLTVELDDGRSLYCTDASRVGKMPCGPFVLGTSGDVLMYVDQSRQSDGTLRTITDAFDDDWGNLLTYVPAERIQKLCLRRTAP